ncbi:alpha/beta fold hydrolase [Phaeovulum vinaykumarii]|uniref:Pimeloyl-ACP methyl ester carboxylesterase n=1 Tax=Phaeovulum vinaykumarii TaxID=407234 RepID=A0A1N7M4M3_9RHOB|nr:alpha/beta hydrolase [Phaeovulum vinaykumarii]SIS80992.1 Pimeloyl-ACP methyl ester carboxylesterase [Phaeovulum vinaykumarii]SOC08767.1 pimeloyl-ACP methyl ester carboxylesterase [Phaeovulum vinaykumarii]
MSIRHFIAPDGAQLAFRDEGTGLPLLALAGLTRDGRDFDYLAARLDLDRVRLIRPDYRGRGASQHTGADSYTVPQEARDACALLDHLGVARAAVLGTSRGGIVGMMLAATAHDRLAGLCLNDVGPELDPAGLARIIDVLGRRPAARSAAEMTALLPALMPGFENVPAARWQAEVERHYVETPEGLDLPYDPALREAFLAAFAGKTPDLWPLFDACAGLPLALIRGANSDLLSPESAAEMRRRRPDMIFAEVPGRAHIPFLDEPESLDAVTAWLARIEI